MTAVNEVALRLLLKGQREMAAGLSDTAKQTAGLSDATKKLSATAQSASVGLGKLEKSSADVSVAMGRSNAAIVKGLGKVADAQQAAAAAAEKAAKLRIRYADLVAEAQAKQTQGDLDGAAAARANATEMLGAARAAEVQAAALRKSTAASRAQVASLKANRTAMLGASGGGGGVSGSAYRMSALAGLGRGVTKGGLAAGAYLGYEGVKKYGQLATSQTQLTTMAGVPASQLPTLTKWETSNSVGLRQNANTLSQMAYFLASSAPGKPYSVPTLESLIRGSAMFATMSGTDPAAAARVFGTIRANGGLGTKSPLQIAAIARATIGTGDMTADDYIAALGSGGLAVTARQHNISLTQLGGVLANLGDLGYRGSLAGTRVSHAINLLSSPSAAASKVYASLGMSPGLIDQVIRSQGLGAGLQTLQQQLTRSEPFLANQMVTSRAGLAQYGFNPQQAKAIASQGGASTTDLILSRAFGGARQESTVLALLQGMSRTSGKTAEIQAQSSPASFLAAFQKAAKTPTAELKRLDLDLSQLELTIGKKLVPDLISMFNWFDKNEGVVKDAGLALTSVAVPAIGAYAATLVGKGITNTTSFVNGIRGVKPASDKAAQGLGVISPAANIAQRAVMGLTTAVGIWEVGTATAGHGAGGAAAAGLSGAMSGLVTGLVIGGEGAGPWGAVIGAAGGALVGLSGHFLGASKAAGQANQQFDDTVTSLTNILGLQKKMWGQNSKTFINQYLGKHTGLAQQLYGQGVNIKDLQTLFRVAGNWGALSPTHTAAQLSNSIIAADPTFAGILSMNGGDRGLWDLIWYSMEAFPKARALAGINSGRRKRGSGTGDGQPGHGLAYRAVGGPLATGQSSWVGERGPEIITPLVPSYVTPHERISRPVIEMHVHSYLDGREVAESVAKHMLDAKARQ